MSAFALRLPIASEARRGGTGQGRLRPGRMWKSETDQLEELVMKSNLSRRFMMAAAAATLAFGVPATADEMIVDSIHFLIPGGAVAAGTVQPVVRERP